LNLQEIKPIAKAKGINARNLKKTDLIRTIQKAEGNSECYGSAAYGVCEQMNCLWRDDCLVCSVKGFA
jgi:hypothetical protein